MAKATKTTALQQAPESGSGPTATKAKRDRMADHELLNKDGEEAADEESATGARYTLLANDESVEYHYGKNEPADRMYALFGFKTLATNESSAARNSAKGAASPDEQIEAVRARHALIQTGVWVDRTREGVGKVDPDALAKAFIIVIVGEGKVSQADADSQGLESKYRDKADKDQAWARQVRALPKVLAEYNALVGKTVASVDDLMKI